MTILETKELLKIYGSGDTEVRALDGVNLSVESGDFVAVVGTSGSGKSTLLHMLGGLDRPTSGTVIVDGKDIFSLKDEALTIFRRRKIGFVFQNYNLVPVLNVYENIVLPIQLDGGTPDPAYIDSIVETLGLQNKLQNLPGNLSGGQQQRVAIALTTLLFTSLFTIVMSINETNQNYQFRSVGSYAHGAFKSVDESQIETLSAHPKIKEVGRRTVIGICTSGAFEKDYGEVSFMDDNNAKWSFATPDVGRTPQNGREITMDTKALAILGVEPELGAEVTLTYTLTDKNQLGREVTDTFTLVGWWEYDELMAVHYFNISEEYAKEMLIT